MRVVYFGTPPIAASVLEYLIDAGLSVQAVVTRPDKPKGRSKKLLPSAVKQAVLDKWPSLPVFSPEKASTESFANTLKSFEPDLFVVFAYGEIIKTNLLTLPTHGCINIHGSLLPKYRGAAPIQRAIMNGETETGITIIEMVLKMDAGDMIETASTPIGPETTFGELEKKLCDLAGPTVLRAIQKIESNTAVKTPQDESQVTFAPKITLEDRAIDWARSASELHNQIRGLSPQPGAFCFVEIAGQKKRLGIKLSKIVESPQSEPGSTQSYEKDHWVVACGEGALSLLEVQLEGKKSLLIDAFIRGNPTAPILK